MDEQLFDQLLPRSLEAEAAVLGSILLSREAADEAAVMLTPDDFSDDANAIAYRAMMRVHDEGKPANDLRLVIEKLKSSRKTDEQTEWDYIDGPVFVRAISQAVGSPAHIVHYADIVRRKAALRRLHQVGAEAMQLALNPETNPDEAVGAVEARITEIATGRLSKRGDVVDLSRAFSEALDRIEHRSQNKCGEGIATGYAQIDTMTGGLRARELLIIAARTSQGKSVLAVNICENIALRDNRSVLLVSLEMTAAEIAERVLSSQSRTKLWQMRNGSITPAQRAGLVEASGRFSQCNLYIDDAPSRNVSEIASIARKLKRGKEGLDVLVVDYVGLVRPDNPRDPREQQVAKVVRRLKILARELAIPVVALAQVNRQPEQKNRAPMLSDLRESGSLEQDADMVWFIHWPDGKPADAEAAEIHIAKQRNGPTGVVKLQWLRDYVRFDDQPETPWNEQRANWQVEQKQEQSPNVFDAFNNRPPISDEEFV